jgi:hypothetical protein
MLASPITPDSPSRVDLNEVYDDQRSDRSFTSGATVKTNNQRKKQQRRKQNTRQQTRDAAVAKSEDDQIELAGFHKEQVDKEKEKSEKERKKRHENTEYMRSVFEKLHFVIYKEPRAIYAASVLFAINLILFSVMFLHCLINNTDLPALAFSIMSMLALLTVIAVRALTEMKSKKAVVMLAIATYGATMLFLALLQLKVARLPVLVYTLIIVYICFVSIYAVTLLSASRYARWCSLNPKVLYEYRFLAWVESTKMDTRPDSNATKKIKYDSQLMRLTIHHYDDPIRVTTTLVCAELLSQIVAQGVIGGNMDLESCSNAAEGAMRRISTINVDKTRIFENGLEYKRTKHVADALLKSSLQRGVLKEPALGF